MKTASKSSHLVISSAANCQNLFQILLFPIVLYLYYGIGTYVKLLFATSGRNDPQNTSPHSDATPIIVGLHPPLFICMVDVKLLYLQQTCVFLLSIVLVMCSCKLSMELSRTFLFSYLSFCDCHLLLSVFDCHLQCGEFFSYLLSTLRLTTVRQRAQHFRP